MARDWLNPLFPRPVLMALPPSRAKPWKRVLRPFHPLRLFCDEHLLWRLAARRFAADDPAILRAIAEAGPALQALSGAALRARLRAQSLSPARLLGPEGVELTALVLEVFRRHLGFSLRENQLICARALLAGVCAELRTGEGKTYAAGLAALLAGLSGVRAHVITVNDYLAQRDHDHIAPLAAELGLSSAVILQQMEDADRLAAYDCDLVYGANKTFVFDHLRDLRERRSQPGRPGRQTGQVFAIIDEADSVLIDDATTPMILSEPSEDLPPEDVTLFADLTAFAEGCRPGRGLITDRFGHQRLTAQGVEHLAAAARHWAHPIARSDGLIALAEKALAARFGFQEGEAYVRREAAIEMIDQSTGRLMPDRKWDYGLQQLVELRAGVPLSPENRAVGQITQQSYFRQYASLSGLTGTAGECRAELWAIYRLPVRPVAPHAPSRLVDMGLRVLPDGAAKARAIFERAASLAGAGRAVLIGLNDVREAAALAQEFTGSGLDFCVLDALSEAEEADLVAAAGRAGRVTIATHLAGRGTDISPDPQALAAGGLHVILGSAMASARLERQLSGRAGRKGQPGSHERIIALDDRMLTEGDRSLRRSLLTRALRVPLLAPGALALLQKHRDRHAQVQRRRALMREQTLIQQLGYR